MARWPFRFIHAADLHLERLAHGLTEIPDHLRDLLMEAPYLATERVVETVLREEADFLVLSGDMLVPSLTGPRGPLFLVEQFQRLQQRRIPVYWAGGAADPPDAWPAWLALPENVVYFPRGTVGEHLLQHDGSPLVRIVGTSRDQSPRLHLPSFHPDPAGAYTIAVAHGTADPAAMQARGLQYWALGGKHSPLTLFEESGVAHYPGSHQGRQPEEVGPHGCTLVQVDPEGRTRLASIPTDVYRWVHERVAIHPKTNRTELQTALAERVRALKAAHEGCDLLITWTIVGVGSLIRRLRRGDLAVELLAWLRGEYGFGPPAAWTVELRAELPEQVPGEWYQQESIRTDFLEAVRQIQRDPQAPIDLEPYVDRSQLDPSLASATTIADDAQRAWVLRRATLLGVDLLSGEESQ